MIHYALRCGGGHEFDGWFKNSASFDAQAARGLLDCPTCNDTRVERALMTPRLRTGGRAVAEPPPASIDATPEQQASSANAVTQNAATPNAVTSSVPAPIQTAMPDQMRAVMQRLRAEVEKRCDYVGPRFADEARRIHAGQEAPRPIYGEATPEQAEALADDGIGISRIPWVPRADS